MPLEPSPKPIAVKHIERAESSMIDQIAAIGVTTVYEAQGRSGLLSPELRPIYPDACIAGSAVTVLTHPGDNWMLHVAMELCEPGDILVVACTDASDHGYFGDLLASSARSRGVRGLVIEGGVRDIRTLKQMEFPVWTKAVHALGTVKERPGSVNVPIVCGGQLINPGDIVVADDDGVCAVSRDSGSEVLELAKARESLEREKRAKFEAGILGLDLYEMRAELSAAGLIYAEDMEEYENIRDS